MTSPDFSVVRSFTMAIFGSFNPQIFRSRWLLENHVFDDVIESDKVLPEFVNEYLVALDVGDVGLEVTDARLLLRVDEHDREERLQRVLDRLTALLPHCPVRAFSVGHDWRLHFEQQRDARVILNQLGTPESIGGAAEGLRRLEYQDLVAGHDATQMRVVIDEFAGEDDSGSVVLQVIRDVAVGSATDDGADAIETLAEVQSRILGSWTDARARAEKIASEVIGAEATK